MKDEKGSPKVRAIYERLIDSALVIAVVLAGLQFSGWTYRQAFLKRFSIDPSSLNSSNVAISVEGFTAIVTTFVAWAIASVSLFALAIGAWFFIRWVDRRRGNDGTLTDQTSILMAQVSCFLLVLMIVLASGSIAGREAAGDRIANVRRGEVWTYHLERETVAGVPIAQSDNTLWILTRTGVRLIRTTDVRLINGPLLKKLAAASYG